MHPEARKALLTSFTEALIPSAIRNGRASLGESDFSALQKSLQSAQKQFGEWVEQADIIGIVFRCVNQVIEECEPDDAKRGQLEGPSLKVLGAEAVFRMADTIMDFLETLPREYSTAFKLPFYIVDRNAPEIQLTESILIETTDTEETNRGVLPVQTYCRQVRVSTCGFATVSASTGATRDAISALKRICFLGAIAGDVNPWGWAIAILDPEPDKPHQFAVTDLTGDKFLGSGKTPMAMSRELRRISPIEKSEGSENFAKLAANEKMLRVLKPNGDVGAEIRSIQMATEWAFDSKSADDDRIGLLQITVALEALLGEGLGPEDAITSALSDRCAYLIGKNAQERKLIRKNFRNLYQARSNIVHGKHAHLSEGDRATLYWGQSILKQCLEVEINNLPD